MPLTILEHNVINHPAKDINISNMKKYIGTKFIMAEPMTVTEAQKVIKPVTGEDDGYLVEYKDGYKSWLPKSVFEEVYKYPDTFLDRLEIELIEISDKIDKLNKFFDTDIFKSLSKQKQTLLQAQFSAMLTYSQILIERIRIEEE